VVRSRSYGDLDLRLYGISWEYESTFGWPYLSSLGDLALSLLSSSLRGEYLRGGLLARAGDFVRQLSLAGERRNGDLRRGDRSREPG
jgi:hypothetical protein